MWTALILGILIVLGFGTAIIMAIYRHGAHPVMPKRTKTPTVTIVRQEASGLDIEELVTKVAAAVATKVSEDLLEKIKGLGQYVPEGRRREFEQSLEDVVSIDESIIPVAVETTVEYTNLNGMVKEEEQKDEGLAQSKSKLAELLKKKNG